MLNKIFLFLLFASFSLNLSYTNAMEYDYKQENQGTLIKKQNASQSKASSHEKESLFKKGFLLTKEERELKKVERLSSVAKTRTEISCNVNFEDIEKYQNMWTNPRYDFKNHLKERIFPDAESLTRDNFDYRKLANVHNLSSPNAPRYFDLIMFWGVENLLYDNIVNTNKDIDSRLYCIVTFGDQLIKNTLENKDSIESSFENGCAIKGNKNSGLISTGSKGDYIYFSIIDNENKLRYMISRKPYQRFENLGKTYYLGKTFIPLISRSLNIKAQVGFVLDDKFSLVPPPSFLVFETENSDYVPVQYMTDPYTNLPYFVELIKPVSRELIFENEDLSFCINVLGGIEKLEKDRVLISKSIFRNFSETTKSLTPIEAREILYIGHQILEKVTEEDKEIYSQEINKINISIEAATQMLLETEHQNEYAQEKFIVTQEEINQALKKEADIQYPSLQQNAKREEKKERKNKIKKFNKIQKQRVGKELIEQKKELFKKKIAQKILQDTQEKMQGQHVLKSSEVKEFLGIMTDKFQQYFPVLNIKASKARGSHAATEIINVETGASNHINLANRSQGEYKIGTVRKIIYDNWVKLFDLAIENKM